jgi:hypothetical protein
MYARKLFKTSDVVHVIFDRWNTHTHTNITGRDLARQKQNISVTQNISHLGEVHSSPNFSFQHNTYTKATTLWAKHYQTNVDTPMESEEHPSQTLAQVRYQWTCTYSSSVSSRIISLLPLNKRKSGCRLSNFTHTDYYVCHQPVYTYGGICMYVWRFLDKQGSICFGTSDRIIYWYMTI